MPIAVPDIGLPSENRFDVLGVAQQDGTMGSAPMGIAISYSVVLASQADHITPTQKQY